MHTVSTIIEKLGGSGETAVLLNVKPSAASEMKRRGTIPVWHWPKLIEACKAKKVRGVNYDLLVSLHQKEESAA